jgi:hypothetical protein
MTMVHSPLSYLDQDSHFEYRFARKANSLARQYKFHLYCPLHFLLSKKLRPEASEGFWELSLSVSYNNEIICVGPGRNHIRTPALLQRHPPYLTTTTVRTKPHPNTNVTSTVPDDNCSADETTSEHQRYFNGIHRSWRQPQSSVYKTMSIYRHLSPKIRRDPNRRRLLAK